MHARSCSWLFLIAVLALGTQVAWGDAPAEVALGWTWDQVGLQVTAAGETECTVRGALLQASEPGEPALPAYLVRIPAPEGARPSGFEIAGEISSTRDLSVPVAATLKDAPTEAGGPVRVERLAAADKAPMWPSNRVRFLGISLGRGIPYAQFAVYPLVIEGGKRVRLLESGTLVVRWQADPSVPLPLKSLRDGLPESPERGTQSSAGDLGKVLAPTQRPALIGDPVDYVVLTRKNMVSAIQPFVDWKNQSGTSTVVRTVEWIDSTYTGAVDGPARIRAFLIEAYRYWGTEWLLIVGGPNEVPIRTCRSYSWSCPSGIGIITDLYYGGLDGTWNDDGNAIFGEGIKPTCPTHLTPDGADFDPELYVGRVPANGPEQVQIFVQKALKYEKNPDLGGYLDKFLLLGEVLFDVNWTRAQLDLVPPCGICDNSCNPCVILDGARDCFNVVNILSQATDLTMIPKELYEWYEYWRADPYNRTGAILEKWDDVVARMNEGCGIMHHVGHGDRDRMSVGTSSGNDGLGRFLVSDARGLTNGDKQGILYSINCSSAAIDYDCLAEAMLFCPTGGVVAYIGSTNLDFPSVATKFQNSTYTKLLLEPRERFLGKAFYKTITEQLALVGEGDTTYERFLAYSLILLGDPQTSVWLGTPKPMIVSAPASMVLGDSTLTVSVTRQGSPLGGALVCAYKAGDVSVTGTTGSNGQAVLKFRPTSTGPFGLTITHPKSVPIAESGTRSVVASGSRSAVSVAELTVDDLTSTVGTPTEGNDDKRFDEAETVKLNLKLRNTGGAASGAMTIGLSVQPSEIAPYVEILDGAETFDALSAGGTITRQGVFRLHLLPGIPDLLHQNGDRLPIEAVIRIAEPGRVSTFHVPLPAYRPRFDLYQGILTELGGGDGDNLPDNGETMLWRPVLDNYGTGTAANLEGTLTAESGATIVNGYGAFPLNSATQGSRFTTTGETSFRFVVVNAAGIALRFKVRSTLDQDFAFLDAPIDLVAPVAPSFPPGVLIDATKDAVLLSWPASPDADIQGYLVERALSDAGPFALIQNGLLKEMTYFRDGGLAGLTRYYYRVAAVDSSGNHSAFSTPVVATTNAAVMAGWPFTLADPNQGAPTVENLDATGHYELFLAADRVYGMRSNGTEIIDGDGISSTPGVWSDLGSSYWSKPAIADIDLDGKVEVVATSRHKSTSDTGRGSVFVWSREGTPLWQNVVGQGPFLLASPVLADIAGDTKLEVIAQNRGALYAWNSDGTPVIPENADGKLVYLGGGDPDAPGTYPYNYGSPAVANLDAEGKDEIVVAFSTNDAGSPQRLIVVDGDGTVLATKILEQGYSGDRAACNSSPSIANVDAEARYEIFVATRTRLWSFRYQAQEPRALEQVWSKPIDELPTKWLEATPAIGDVDGVIGLDVVIGTGLNRILAVNASTGSTLAGFPKTLPGASKKIGSAILANIDVDAPAEIIVGDNEGIVHAINGDPAGGDVAGFPYLLGGRIQNGLAVWDLDRDRHPNLILQSEQLPQVTVLDIQGVNFPTDIGEAMAENPWPSYRHDARNTGRIDAKVITPVAMIQVETSAEAGTAILAWTTPVVPAAFRIEKRNEAGTWDVRGEGEASLFAAGDSYAFRDTVEPGRHMYRLFGYGSAGEVLFQSAQVEVTVQPFRLGFVGVGPNPFHGQTALRFEAPTGSVRLDILDLSGRRVRTLTRGSVRGGVTEALWDGRDDSGHAVGSGVYLARLQGIGGTRTEKLVLLRR